MEQCAVRDGPREVGGEAATGRKHPVHGEDAALVVETDIVVHTEIVPLARGGHVVVPVGT